MVACEDSGADAFRGRKQVRHLEKPNHAIGVIWFFFLGTEVRLQSPGPFCRVTDSAECKICGLSGRNIPLAGLAQKWFVRPSFHLLSPPPKRFPTRR